jgi:hypothetical protein
MPNGIFLNAKDIMNLRGINSYKSAWRFLNRISKRLNKPSANSITIDEYCEMFAVNKEIIMKAIKN